MLTGVDGENDGKTEAVEKDGTAVGDTSVDSDTEGSESKVVEGSTENDALPDDARLSSADGETSRP